MAQFNFVSPATAEEAVEALSRSGAWPLGGGTDLLVQLKSGRVSPNSIVDLKKISGLIGIRQEGDAFIIGASTSGAEIGEHPGLRKTWPGVVEAANLIGSTQVQGRASLAGNLCNASPAADSVPALIAARAVCIVVGPGGKREVPVEAIPVGPGRNSLAPGEFILEIRLPPRPARSGDAYLRMIPRTEMDIAVVGAGVSLTLDSSGVIETAHVALGAVAPTALLVETAGSVLVGTRLEAETLARLDAAAQAACKPISDKRGTVEYRTQIAGVLARRAALTAFKRAGEQA